MVVSSNDFFEVCKVGLGISHCLDRNISITCVGYFKMCLGTFEIVLKGCVLIES